MNTSKRAGFFVTGTGTGVGKTYVSGCLAKAISSLCPVTYLKPVQTGCIREDGGPLSAPDFNEICQRAPIITAQLEDHVPYRFEPACSPHLAARLAACTIDFGTILRAMDKVQRLASLVIVEGAGGIYAPLDENSTMLDLMREIGLPVILVASAGLGTLNHTRMSLEVLAAHKFPLAAVIINDLCDGSQRFIIDDNIATIRTFSPAPVAVVPYATALEPEFKEFCHDLARTQL